MTIRDNDAAKAVIVGGTAFAAPEIKPDLENLRAYTQTKLALAGQLRILREALRALGREHGERQCEELIVKLAEDRFTLAVLGQFKRGKSSLMNAIIGRELLPTGVLPLTSAITVLKYGPAERLVVQREDWSFLEELPVSALADYVTERGNPSNRQKVKTACVELPVPFLRRGLEFVDTPGVGSAITANTVTTYGFLPECDAVLFVTSADTPLTSLELAFLKEIREYVDRIFFVVNKMDLVAAGERDEIMGFVTEIIRTQSGCDAVKVFPVSARQGIEARMSGDPVLYEQSGLKALEEALASFLSQEKSAAFLAAVAYKAVQIVNQEEGQGTFTETAVQAPARTGPAEKSSARRDPHTAAIAAMEARARLAALYKEICDKQITGIAETGGLAGMAASPGALTAAAIAVPAPAAADMAADLESRSCPVCRYIERYTLDFLADWQYQLGITEQAQAEFAAELGFCPLHTWQLLAISSPHGASVGYARLAEQIARRLRENSAAPAGGEPTRRLVRDARNCRVCGLIRRAEAEYIRRLASMIGEAAGRNRYRCSQGACLRHLGMLVDAVSAAEHQEFLLSHAAQRFEEDAEDMRSYAMKHEAIRRALLNRNEKDAYRRAVIRMAGNRNVCMPWAEDGEI